MLFRHYPNSIFQNRTYYAPIRITHTHTHTSNELQQAFSQYHCIQHYGKTKIKCTKSPKPENSPESPGPGAPSWKPDARTSTSDNPCNSHSLSVEQTASEPPQSRSPPIAGPPPQDRIAPTTLPDRTAPIAGCSRFRPKGTEKPYRISGLRLGGAPAPARFLRDWSLRDRIWTGISRRSRRLGFWDWNSIESGGIWGFSMIFGYEEKIAWEEVWTQERKERRERETVCCVVSLFPPKSSKRLFKSYPIWIEYILKELI